MSSRKLAIVTGASSGIGFEIAKLAAEDGYDLIVAADTPFVEAGPALKDFGVQVEEVEADLATKQGVDQLLAKISDRPVDVLVANAGHGLGHGFLDQSPDEWLHVINTNVTGTLMLVQPIVKRMVERGEGKVLITGSSQATSLVRSRQSTMAQRLSSTASPPRLNEELRDTGVTVTCLKPGATETNFFHRAELDDTKVGQAKKDDPADVAKTGWEAMQKGEPSVIYGLKNKMQVAAAGV